MVYYAFAFEARIAVLAYETFDYTVIYVPPEIEGALDFSDHPRLRVEGEIAERPFNAALIPSSKGRHVILSSDFLRTAGLRLGDLVDVRFNIARQDAVVLPEELELALAAQPAARDAWENLTPGRRRGLAHLVGKLKGAESRQRKADQLVELLSEGAPLPGPPGRTDSRRRQ